MYEKQLKIAIDTFLPENLYLVVTPNHVESPMVATQKNNYADQVMHESYTIWFSTFCLCEMQDGISKS